MVLFCSTGPFCPNIPCFILSPRLRLEKTHYVNFNIAHCAIDWCENAIKRYIIIFYRMQRFCHLIYQSNWCQNASKLIYQKGEISLMWDAENVVYHRFDFDVCRWNQVDVKVDPCQACFFQNTRCSIFPHDPFCPDLLYHMLIPTHVWLITPCLQWNGILMVHDTWLYVTQHHNPLQVYVCYTY